MSTAANRAVNQLALSQHGAFTRAQVHEVGGTDGLIKHRLRTGHWIRLASGAYALPGYASNHLARLKAATLLIPGAVASHESAAELHGFSYVPRRVVAITAARGANHRLALGTVHEYQGILDCDHTVIEGIPTTKPALTIFHLATSLNPKRLERVLDDRLNARQIQLDDLFALADFWSRQGFPGARLMRNLLAHRGPGFIAPESELEAAFVGLVQRFDIPEPTRQFATPWDSAEGRIDFAYPDLKILIEVDGRRWHGRDADFDKDRARDRRAQKAGWIVLRFTWHEVTRMPEHVADELRSFIRSPRAA